MAERYERGSVLLTSNLPFSKWDGIFKDPMTAAAAIDRLVHHSIIIELNIPSYRLEHAKTNVQSLGSEKHAGNTHRANHKLIQIVQQARSSRLKPRDR